MRCHPRWIVVFVAFLSLVWALPAHAFTVIEDHFDVTVSTLPAVQTPISDIHFFRGFTDPNGLPTGQSTTAPDISNANNGDLVSLLLPAVQDPALEKFALVGFCDGSVVVALNADTAKNAIGNSTFNFQTTFGISEPSFITALQGGDTATIDSFFINAYDNGLLPAVQTGAASPGELVSFSTPADFGSISVVENATPEPASLALLSPCIFAFALRRRRCT